MNTVPEMISSKDLDYLKDMLNWNFITNKKANHYLQHIQDEDISSLIKQVSEMHKRHYNMILNILQGGQNE